VSSSFSTDDKEIKELLPSEDDHKSLRKILVRIASYAVLLCRLDSRIAVYAHPSDFIFLPSFLPSFSILTSTVERRRRRPLLQ
jgi:hypothetical protein